jgi:hypothetical protein
MPDTGGEAAAQRWCGWHVTPEMEQRVVLDGPGGQLLRLPTLCVTELVDVTEDGIALDVADLEWSRIGLVRKRSGAAWTDRLGGVVVTMVHGFAEAQDFEVAVLSFTDRMSRAAADGGLPVAVGPFRWSEDQDRAAGGSAFSAVELSILDQYRLERSP